MRNELAYESANTTSTLSTASARRVSPSRVGSNRREGVGLRVVASVADALAAERGVDVRAPARERELRPGPAGDVRGGRLSRAIRPDLSSGQAYGQLALNLGKAAAPA